jgi:hypothetical protein
LEEGAKGETIRILNTQSKQTIEGTVTGKGQVQIDMISSQGSKLAESGYINP